MMAASYVKRNFWDISFLPEVGDKEEQEMLQQAQDLLSSEETTSDSRKETKQLGCQRKTS